MTTSNDRGEKATLDAITELFEPDDYAALEPIRDEGFEGMNILPTHTV